MHDIRVSLFIFSFTLEGERKVMEKEKNIGGLWLKKSKKGTVYMSGTIEIEGAKHYFTVFKNQHKYTDKSPDYTILPVLNFTDGTGKKPLVVEQEEDIDSESIPF